MHIYTAYICFEKRAKFARECEGEICAEYALRSEVQHISRVFR
jgi:hypothetical protein